MNRGAGFFTIVVVANVLWSSVGARYFTPGSSLWIVLPCTAAIFVYFLSLLRGYARLSQRQIDSVYYLGFLTTLAVLGASAYSLADVGTDSYDVVVKSAAAQFALGLLATGLGLFFRLYLQSKASAAGSTSEMLDQYVDTIGKLSNRMNEAASNFERLTHQTIQTASDTSRNAATATLANITEALQPVVGELKTAITDINSSLKRVNPTKMKTLSEAIDGLGKSMSELSSAVSPVHSSMQEFHSELQKSTQAQAQNVKVSQTMSNSLGAVAWSFESVEKSLASMHQALSQCESQFSRSAEAQRSYADSAEKVAATLGSTTRTLGDVTTGLGHTSSELKQLVVSLDSAGLQALSTTLKESVERLGKLNNEVVALEKSVSSAHAGVGQQMNQMSQGFDVQVKEMNDATASLNDAMVNLSRSITKSVQDALQY